MTYRSLVVIVPLVVSGIGNFARGSIMLPIPCSGKEPMCTLVRPCSFGNKCGSHRNPLRYTNVPVLCSGSQKGTHARPCLLGNKYGSQWALITPNRNIFSQTLLYTAYAAITILHCAQYCSDLKKTSFYQYHLLIVKLMPCVEIYFKQIS